MNVIRSRPLRTCLPGHHATRGVGLTLATGTRPRQARNGRSVPRDLSRDSEGEPHGFVKSLAPAGAAALSGHRRRWPLLDHPTGRKAWNPRRPRSTPHIAHTDRRKTSRSTANQPAFSVTLTPSSQEVSSTVAPVRNGLRRIRRLGRARSTGSDRTTQGPDRSRPRRSTGDRCSGSGT